MRYLSIDLEATGLDEECLIIEFAAIPFCTEERKIYHDNFIHHFIKCPSFASLKPTLAPWVVEHNEKLIDRAHVDGIEISKFKKEFQYYIESSDIKEFFDNRRVTLFGKSLNAIDLPFMIRDLGWDFMREKFNHRVQDLTSVAYTFIDQNFLPREAESGSYLMEYLNMGEVKHTALEDAVHTAEMYLKLLDLFSSEKIS